MGSFLILHKVDKVLDKVIASIGIDQLQQVGKVFK